MATSAPPLINSGDKDVKIIELEDEVDQLNVQLSELTRRIQEQEKLPLTTIEDETTGNKPPDQSWS